jgi:hypothetical protein
MAPKENRMSSIVEGQAKRIRYQGKEPKGKGKGKGIGDDDKNKGKGKEASRGDMDELIQLHLRTFSGDSVDMEAHPSHLIAQVKAALPIPPHPDLDIDTDFHIMLKIASDVPLSAHGLKDGDVLYVVRNCEHQVFGIVDEPSEYSTHSSGEPNSKSSEEFEELLAGGSEELDDGP